MEERKIVEVARVLSEWNPLGDAAKSVGDLDGYRTEAIDIVFHAETQLRPRRVERIVMEVLNEAFHISLTVQDCAAPAGKIVAILSSK